MALQELQINPMSIKQHIIAFLLRRLNRYGETIVDYNLDLEKKNRELEQTARELKSQIVYLRRALKSK